MWIGAESGSQRILDAMQRRVTLDRVVHASDLLRRRGIQVGMFIMLGYEGERDEDLRATVEHLKRTTPDIYLTTVSYPIKGTPYYDTVADRVRATGEWADRTDRDLAISGRPRRLLRLCETLMVSEVARSIHWQRGRYAPSARFVGHRRQGRHVVDSGARDRPAEP